jgi:3-methylcrotonyl-CoA carboxylase alpha subunit
MLAKLIAHGRDRLQALDRLGEALDGFQIAGPKTNVGFLRALLRNPDVRSGMLDTGLIERELGGLLGTVAAPTDLDLAAAVAAVVAAETPAAPPSSPWDAGDGWMIAGTRRRALTFAHPSGQTEAVLVFARAGLSLEIDGKASPFRVTARPDGKLDVFLGDRKQTVSAVWNGRDLQAVTPRGRIALSWLDPTRDTAEAAAAAGHFRAPMPGTIRQVLAEPGAALERGSPVLVMEAMKMEHTMRAPVTGRLVALHCAVGDFVQEGTDLAEFEASDPAA